MMGAADFLKISSKKRLTREEMGGNLFRHPKRRDRRESSASGLRDGTEAGSGNLENDTEKRSEQRQLISERESVVKPEVTLSESGGETERP